MMKRSYIVNWLIGLKKENVKISICCVVIITQKVNKMVMWRHDASCPQEKLSNNMARAQFIVPLQYNYNQCYFQRDTRYNLLKIFFSFWEVTMYYIFR